MSDESLLQPPETRPRASVEPRSATDAGRSPATGDLEHVEQLLEEIRDIVDAAAHERAHQQFSAWLTVAGVLQVIAGGLVVLALVDWIFDAETAAILLKLAFAAVFQLGVISALLKDPRR